MSKRSFNVLSLFDGMSCGQIALERSGIKVNRYYASEINKPAIKVATANYPDMIQLGDVTKWRTWKLPRIDLLIGGSPCQGFSFQGKQLAFDDPRSVLFFEFVAVLKALRKRNPKLKFLLENVRMKRKHLEVISTALDVAPLFINSSRLSAQRRARYYWTNIEGACQPKDKGIRLGSIIDGGLVDRDKSFCLVSSFVDSVDLRQHFEKSRGQLVFTKPIRLKRRKSIDRELKGLAAEYSKHKSLPKGWKYRRLTPVECERLQTVPDNYTNKGVSNSNRMVMLGNGWTVEVIAHLFRGLKPPRRKLSNRLARRHRHDLSFDGTLFENYFEED